LITTVDSDIVCGANINVRIAWKLPSNKTYDDWEAEQMVSDNGSVPFRFLPNRFRIRELKMTNGLDFLKTVTHGLHETDRQ
jgi:hypothetical protein